MLRNPGFAYKIGVILIGGIHFVQSNSRKFWISRPLVVTILIGHLSAQDSVRLYRTKSRDWHANSPQLSGLLAEKIAVIYKSRSKISVKSELGLKS